jgi:hypothetical protein
MQVSLWVKQQGLIKNTGQLNNSTMDLYEVGIFLISPWHCIVCQVALSYSFTFSVNSEEVQLVAILSNFILIT